MFVEIKKHSGVLNEKLEEFPDNLLLNLHVVQKLWFRKGNLYQYNGHFFPTENAARNEAEGVSNQKAYQYPQEKFRTILDAEMQKIQSVEVDYIRWVMLGSKEDAYMSIYFPEEGQAEFKRIKRIVEEYTLK